MKFIDTHAHLNLSAFGEDFDDVAKKCEEESVSMINIGTSESSSLRAVELAEQYEHMYATVGLHPIYTVSGVRDEDQDTDEAEVFNKDFYRPLLENKKVVGIGECGYDYFHTDKNSFAAQEENFIAQIELANEFNVPLMIHTRGPKKGQESPTGRSVYADVYDTLRQYAKVSFNVHFYAGTFAEAERFFELGGTISFTGVVTFAKDYEEVVEKTPLELMHAETDCPYVAPVPYRGKRCEPWMVKEVYRKIAKLKKLDLETVRLQLLENAKRHYSL